jgi:hypothetical protein
MMEMYKRTVRGEGERDPELWAPGPPGVGLSHSRIHFHGDSHHDGVTGHISQRTGHSPLSSQHNWCSIYRSIAWLYYFAFPPAVYEGSFFSTSSPTPVSGGVFDDSYSNRGEVES